MKMIQHHKQKGRVILFSLCLIAAVMHGQETSHDLKSTNSRRWSAHIGFGLNSFQTSGIPMSRNQINFDETHPDSLSRYQQESRTAGLCYEFEIRYHISEKGKLGVLLNGFKDDPEYMGGSGISNDVKSIKSDSLESVSIKNLQSYINLGLNYEHRLFQSPSTRHHFHAGLAAGISFNRTPDRTEFDAFDSTNFILKQSQSASDWRITHTDFRSGVFIAPSLNYSLHLKKNQFFRVTISQVLQSNATQEGLKILDKNSSGSGERKNYTLRALQIKIGYAF